MLMDMVARLRLRATRLVARGCASVSSWLRDGCAWLRPTFLVMVAPLSKKAKRNHRRVVDVGLYSQEIPIDAMERLISLSLALEDNRLTIEQFRLRAVEIISLLSGDELLDVALTFAGVEADNNECDASGIIKP
jgi:hypothetical protein